MDEHEEQVPDADLIEQLRAGDRQAAVDLWTRHYPSVLLAARRVTRQPRDAEEIASDAFSGMLSALSSGAGPTASVRAYLVTSVRNLAASRATRSSASDVMTDDVALFDRPTFDTTAHMTELQLVRVAFADLPKRWQVVLWRTAVDKDSNIEVGQAMGLSPNAVAALAKRARRGFRLSYLRAHLSDRGVEAQCKPFIAGLADLSIAEAGAPPALLAHVATCAACTRRVEELRAVNLNFAGVVGPAVLALLPAKLALGAAGVGAVGMGAAGVGAVGGPPAAAGVGGGAGTGGSAGSAPLTAGDGPLRAVWSSRPGARWALSSTAVAGAVAAIVLATRPEVVQTPPVSAPVVTSPPATSSRTPSAPTTRPPTTHPSTPLPGRTTSHPSTPITTAAPARPHEPAQAPTTGTPTTPPRSSTSAPRTSPMTVDLSLSGPAANTSVQVTAAADGIRGPVRLSVELPAGVTLVGATGDWAGCTQDGTTIGCAAPAADPGRWTGTLSTSWTDTARGRVRVTVSGTYANGSPAVGSVGTTWPP